MALNFVKNLKETGHKLTVKEIFSILGLFLAWRAVLQFIAYLGIFRLNLNPDFTSCWLPKISNWYTWWIRWDAGWYLSIVERGYDWYTPGKFSNLAFFPLYPLLVKYLAWTFGNNYILCGVVISNLALLLACFYLYRLVKLDAKTSAAYRSVFYLLIFPTALFFTSMYAESLLLLFCMAAFFYARKNKWLLCGLFGFLAALTKSFGVFLAPVLLLEYLEQRKFHLKKIKWNVLNIGWIPAGLGVFMFYLWKRFKNPFLFLKAQGGWANNPHSAWSRIPNLNLANIGASLTKYFQSIFGEFEGLAFRITAGLELISFILFAILCVVVFLKLRKSYALYMFFGLILSPLTGSLMSMNRYVLVLFPAFILLALWGKNKVINYAIVMLFSTLLALNIIMFVNSYWVG